MALALGVVAGAPSVALCQSSPEGASSRAAELVERRQEKATRLKGPGRGIAERVLYWYENQFGPGFLSWRGLHVVTGSFATGAGPTLGVGYTKLAVGSAYADDDRPNRVDIDAAAAYSAREYFLARSRVTLRNLGSTPLDLSVWGRIYEFPEEDFFGLGPATREGDRAAYQINSSEFGADLSWRTGAGVRLGVGAAYLNPRIGPGQDSRYPSADEVFDPATIPGYTDTPDFLRLSAEFSFDYRDNPRLPGSGGLYRLRAREFQDRDAGRYDFRQFEADVEQHFRLGHPFRVLALRAAAVVSDTNDGDEAPFFYQPTLGGAQRLRGFREFRFRDRNSMLFTAEYQWQVWWLLDMALFVDAGEVARRRSDLALKDLEASYGLGFRFHGTDAFAGRLDLAVSREGVIPFLSFVYVF